MYSCLYESGIRICYVCVFYIYIYVCMYVYVIYSVRNRERDRARKRIRERGKRRESSQWKTCTNVQTKTRLSPRTIEESRLLYRHFHWRASLYTSFLPTCALYYIANVSRHDSMSTATRLYVERKELAEGLTRSLFHAFV